MKDFKNIKNELFAYDEDCFDEEGQATNEIVEKIIQKNNLIEITHEEADAIRNYKSPEQIAEEERLAKLPTAEELQKNKIELVALDLIMSMKGEGVI